MKIYLAKNNLDILFQVDNNDSYKTMQIMEMMKSQGWKIYQEYLRQIRNEMLEIGKNGIMRKISRDLSAEKWAMLYGFDLSTRFIQTILDAIQEFMERAKTEEKREVNQNGSNDD